MVILTRKDMSLTRRFYNWILSTPEGSESESLSQYSTEILISSFKVLNNSWLYFNMLSYVILVIYTDRKRDN